MRYRAAGSRWRGGSLEHRRRARAAPSSWTSCIGARSRARTAARDRARARRRRRSRTATPARRALADELGEEHRRRGRAPMTSSPARARCEGDPAGARAELEDRPAGLGRRARSRAGGRRCRRRTRRRARRRLASGAVVGSMAVAHCQYSSASPRSSEQRAQLEQRGVGGEGEQARPVRRRDGVVERAPRSVRRDLDPLGSASRRTSAAAPSPAARVPAQMTRRTRAGEQLEVGVPDPGDVAAVGDPVVQRDPEVDALRRRRASRPRAAASAAPRWRRPGS